MASMCMKEAIRWYVDRFGIGELQNGRKLVSVLRDLCRDENRSINMLDMLISNGGVIDVFIRPISSSDEKMRLAMLVYHDLTDRMGFSAKAADYLIYAILFGIGWFENELAGGGEDWRICLQATNVISVIEACREYIAEQGSFVFQRFMAYDHSGVERAHTLLQEIIPSAEAGLIEAQYITGQLYRCLKKKYLEGLVKSSDKITEFQCKQELERSASEEIHWFEMAAKEEHVDAAYALGYVHQENLFRNSNNQVKRSGITLPGNMELALYWLKKAVDNNHGEACLVYADILRKDIGSSVPEIEEVYRKAVQLATPHAECAYAYFWDNTISTRGVRPSEETLLYFEQRMNKIESSDDRDLFIDALSNCYYSLGCFDKAFEYDKQNIAYADRQGIFSYSKIKRVAQYFATAKISEAMEYIETIQEKRMKVQFCLVLSNYCWAQRNYTQGIEWSNLALSVDCENKQAMHLKGICLMATSGHNHLRLKNAIELIRHSAELGYSDAEVSLGELYENGHGVEKDFVYAAQLYERAARKQNGRGAGNIGSLYLRGCGVPQDYKKAIEYLRIAADAGYVRSFVDLGYCYETGRGVECDMKRAFELYMSAAKANNPYATRNVGLCYEFGKGVEKNLVAAKEFFCKAKELGHPSVTDDIQRVNNAISLDNMQNEAEVLRAKKTEAAKNVLGLLEQQYSLLEEEKATLHGMFSMKRKKEIDKELASIYQKILNIKKEM